MIKKGDRVKFYFIGKLEDGTVFTHNKTKKPVECIVGKGKYIKAVEGGLVGMREFQRKQVLAIPNTGYGVRDKTLVKKYPRQILTDITEDMTGQIIHLRNFVGRDFSATVVEVTDDFFILDLNHPLAGKNLIFELEVVSVSKNRDGNFKNTEICEQIA